jgi:hypothetical protein
VQAQLLIYFDLGVHGLFVGVFAAAFLTAYCECVEGKA